MAKLSALALPRIENRKQVCCWLTSQALNSASERERALRPLAIMVQLVCDRLDRHIVLHMERQRVDGRNSCAVIALYGAGARLPACNEMDDQNLRCLLICRSCAS